MDYDLIVYCAAVLLMSAGVVGWVWWLLVRFLDKHEKEEKT